MGGISNPALYNSCETGTKELIEEYQNEVTACIQMLYSYEGKDLTLPKKLDFFKETIQAYGRTALFLSGGGSFAKYHFGVIKALYE